MTTEPALSLPLGRGVEVLRVDAQGLVALLKPAGVLSHPNERADQPRSVLDAAYVVNGEYFEWTASAGAKGRLWLLNRLDSATSGVILACLSQELAVEIRNLFQKRHIHKVYNALVFGFPPQASQVWKDRLAVDKRGGQIRTGGAGNIPAESHMRLLRSQRGDPVRGLLELTPKTGRSHQLRVQCARRHLPIVGDATYGDFKANREFAKRFREKRLFLHSLETAFDYEWKGKTHHFQAKAPLPEAFERCLA